MILRFFGSRLGLSLLGVAALGAALWGALAWHGARSEAAITAAVDAALVERDAQWKSAFDTMHGAAEQWRRNYEARRDMLVTARRQAHETELRRIGAGADALRLRGPGLAAAAADCRPRHDPGLAAAAGRSDAPAAKRDAPRPELPERDGGGGFAVVPWGWLVRRAEEHDALLSESAAWRLHDAEQRALLADARDDLRRRLDAVRPAFGGLPGHRAEEAQ